jgi:hypothetical protein
MKSLGPGTIRLPSGQNVQLSDWRDERFWDITHTLFDDEFTPEYAIRYAAHLVLRAWGAQMSRQRAGSIVRKLRCPGWKKQRWKTAVLALARGEAPGGTLPGPVPPTVQALRHAWLNREHRGQCHLALRTLCTQLGVSYRHDALWTEWRLRALTDDHPLPEDVRDAAMLSLKTEGVGLAGAKQIIDNYFEGEIHGQGQGTRQAEKRSERG